MKKHSYKNNQIHSPNQGFTLIELSIVLIIIGLLSGAILAGRDLIHAAEILKQVKQLHDYETAVSTFKLKYECVPGDCANATDYFPTAVNGNGDGLIENNWGADPSAYNCSASAPFAYSYDKCDDNVTWSQSTEYQQFFVQLSLAGLIPGNFIPTVGTNGPILGTNIPTVALNASVGFFAGDTSSFYSDDRNPAITNYRKGNNALWLVGCDMKDQAYIYQTLNPDLIHYWDDYCGVMTPADAFAIDTKIDDGQALSGKFMGFGGYESSPGYTDCLTGNSYNLLLTNPECQAAYVFN